MEKINKTKEKGNIDITELAINLKGAIEVLIILAFGTSMICMAACDKKKNKNQTNEKIEAKQTSTSDLIVENIAPGTIKEFDEGEHILSVRVKYGWINNDELTGYAINNMPEGYEVFQITPYTDSVNRGSATEGYDIWFKNTEKVEVEATYSKVFNNYGYYTFGKPIEKEKALSK